MGAKHHNAAYQQLREIDRVMLDRIVELGDDLRQPRHTLLYFYRLEDGSRTSLEIVAAAASEKSLTVTRENQDVVIMEGHLHVDPAAVKALVDWALDLASRANAEFDGWECAVIEPKH